ncbi:tetratricopeptide repeat protein [Chitinophaga nivalis]|uniref:Regulator of microtubule dynamics protein 1 n=1 Tax=Chitinophaga nivalis TaxID=2991709 RepID=A0ABT3IPV4_9BACT|nr:tetratricopeptide repeat protein [Chitinophaga nivalis]MCW3464310.1 tetratricopeptide repeat protein [Chitinophaga nivalis]MCW3485999.1 tetratricopeptide repeat protein [Chitinophaga nivalis]
MFKRIMAIALLIMTSHFVKAQSVSDMVEEAKQLEKQMKEAEALEKDKEILKIQPNEITALTQASQLCSRVGNRQKSKSDKVTYFNQAKSYAQQALKIAPDNADANNAMAVAMGRMALISGAKDKVAASKDVKKYAEIAIKLNPSLAQAYHVLGKWNFEVANLNVFERGAAKMLFGGLPEGTLQVAINNYEKCRQLDPGFILNYYELARAYKQNDQQDKAIEVLKKALTLRNISQDDASIKVDCKKMLDDLQ